MSGSPSPLPARLEQAPYEYEFFQAVRLLERLLAPRAPVGRFRDPSQEAVRFSTHQSTSFPPSENHSLERRDESPARLAVNFMGLTGATGVLPTVVTNHVIDRMRAGDHTPAAFFDLFNHRLISLFYRAWKKYRFPVCAELGEPAGLDRALLSVTGLAAPSLQNRQPVSDESLKFYAGLLAAQSRSGAALEQLLTDYFNAPITVLPFQGRWRPVDPADQCLLDIDGSGGAASQLGLGAIAGDEVWEQQSTVRLRIGPLPLARYVEFLPDGSAAPALAALSRFFSRDSYDFEVQLVLRAEEAPPVVLGGDGPAPRLGWVSWMRTRPLDRDPSETIYSL